MLHEIAVCDDVNNKVHKTVVGILFYIVDYLGHLWRNNDDSWKKKKTHKPINKLICFLLNDVFINSYVIANDP